MPPLPRVLLLVLSALLLATAPAAAQASAPEEVVERFLAAYNRHDVDALLALAHPDLQWLSIDGERMVVETADAAAFGDAVRKYFAGTPSARSTVESRMVAGRFVSVWERAHWRGSSGDRSQSALSVYEVEGDRVRRVWYYPAQR